MNRARGVQRQSGFTLIEVLVGLVLLALLLGVVMSATRLGIGLWTHTERLTADSADVAAAQAFVRRSIVTAVPSFADASSADPTILFDGAADHLTLVGPWPGTGGNGPWARLRLFTAVHGRAHGLYVAWQADLPPSGTEPAAPPSTALLLDHVTALRLSYFGAAGPDGAPAWTDTWTNRANLPALVRVAILRDEPSRPGWTDLVAAPRANMNAACIFDAMTETCEKVE